MNDGEATREAIVTPPSASDSPPPPFPPGSRMHDSGTGIGVAVCVLTLPFLMVGVVFLPLGLAGLENATLGSHRVEDFFRDVGLHDELSLVYDPVFDFFL